ncbi:S-layer homology domain-containing protein [Paenibacillus camelliae]|uniref:S-layer homology domain-containing protein n=1 Tax=Paenibacillus camelliae TaxID=512410 RepID=UPI00203B219E|nr:S-layer homology domain-containing protein [Paenibacillus camelliae]MCM3633830.1 S-layer homology domain-containing protein [Paenibacillus camelliae]
MNNKFVKTITSLTVAALLVGTAPAYVLAEEAATVTAIEQQQAEKSIVHFINASKPSSLSSMIAYIANPNVYEKDGVTYLRIDVQQVYDVKITVEGKEGVKAAQYDTTVIDRSGKEQQVTYFTLDYALSDASKAIEAEASYFVPSFFTEPQSHDIYIMINNDVEAALKELAVLLPQAQAVAEPSKGLAAAIAKAEAANSYLTEKAELEKAVEQLRTAFAEEPIATPVHYVNESDPSKLSVMGNYLDNAKTYKKDGAAYLRVDVQQSYDVKVLVEGKEGTKVAEYETTINGRTGPQQVTYFTFDYALSNINEVLEASASYFVPGVFEEPQSHDIKLVIGEDVEASKAKLLKAIAAAETVAEPSESLKAAIAEANSNNSYLRSNAELAAAAKALIEQTKAELSFTDLSSHWAKNAITNAVATGIASGYPDGSFKPDQYITRAEFTKLLVEGLELAASAQALDFTDAESIPQWAQSFVQAAVSAEVITGYQDGSFRSDGHLTRAEMAVMITKALDLELEAAEALTFNDADSIPSYAKERVATAVKHGLIQGLSQERFGANEKATRAQAVSIILRAAEQQ